MAGRHSCLNRPRSLQSIHRKVKFLGGQVRPAGTTGRPLDPAPFETWLPIHPGTSTATTAVFPALSDVSRLTVTAPDCLPAGLSAWQIGTLSDRALQADILVLHLLSISQYFLR